MVSNNCEIVCIILGPRVAIILKIIQRIILIKLAFSRGGKKGDKQDLDKKIKNIVKVLQRKLKNKRIEGFE